MYSSGSSSLQSSGLMILVSLHRSSSCINDLFSSDICLFPFGRLEFYGSGQLALLTAPGGLAVGAPEPVTAERLHSSARLGGDFMVTRSLPQRGPIKSKRGH